MSNQSIPLSQLQPSPGAKWAQIGDKHAGRLISAEQRQQTDLKDGSPKFFASGDPMMQWLITLEEADGTTVVLYAKGGNYTAATGTGWAMQVALVKALEAAGATELTMGGQLAVAWTGESEPRPGMNAAHLYTAQYVPPKPAAIPVDLFSEP